MQNFLAENVPARRDPNLEFPFRKLASIVAFSFALILFLANPAYTYAQLTISPGNGTFTGVGGTLVINVTADPGVGWTAESNADWLTIAGAASGNGSGTVTIAAATNDTDLARTAQVTIGTATFFAVQEPLFAVIQFLPDSISVGASGALRSIQVLVQPPNLTWQAVSNVSWISVVTPPDVGSGSLTIVVATNNGLSSRTGTVSVMGNNLTVNQSAGTGASFSLSSAGASFPYTGGEGTVNVTANPADAQWVAYAGAPWITLTQTQFTGNGTVNYMVQQNPDDSPRQAVISIAGTNFTISQAANPNPQEPPPPTSTFSFSSGIVSFTVPEGSTTEVTQSLGVTSTGAALNFNVEVDGAAWLRARSTSGTTPTNILFTADPTGLVRGVYLGTIRFRSTSNTAVVEIPARIRVTPPEGTPTLPRVAPRSLYFSRIVGNEPPAGQTIVVGEAGDSPTVTVSIPPSATWLQAAAVNGANGTNVNVAIRNLNFLPGLYEAAITISSPANQFETFTIPVAYRVQMEPAGKPYISSGGIVSAASFEQGISGNTWISIFGTNLANSTRDWRSSDFVGGTLPTRLDGVEVTVDGEKAAIAYVSPGQLNILPKNVNTLAGAEIIVSVDGDLSEAAVSYLQENLPAFFTFQPMDGKYAAALHLDNAPVGPAGLFSSGRPARPAKPGDVIQIFGTGFGATNPPVDPTRLFQGAAALVDRDLLEITIGGMPATVGFAGLSATGLNQFNVTVPSLPAGDYELVAKIGTVYTQTGVFIRVEP